LYAITHRPLAAIWRRAALAAVPDVFLLATEGAGTADPLQETPTGRPRRLQTFFLLANTNENMDTTLPEGRQQLAAQE
jgi:hypothetical protein